MNPIDYSSRLNKVIPGGAHTYSRGDDQFPGNAPQILSKGEGCYVWDAYGNKYLDYGMGLRSVTVGYGYEPIARAAMDQIVKGNNLSRASEIELEAAELISELIPADMVKFAKNGSTVTTAAVKLARAYTGRKHIAVCSQQPFFSYDDWFIGSTSLTKGIPTCISSLTLKFNYNDLNSLEQLFSAYPGEIACVIMEPATSVLNPCEGRCNHTIYGKKTCKEHQCNTLNFLHEVKELCHKNKVVFILDEMITGFRWHLQGAQKYFEVEPDLCTFGKGIANGFSVAALAGKREIMNLGGIKEEGQERVFLVSTTHGAEMCGLGAMVKTIDVYKELQVVPHMWDYGKKLIDGMNHVAEYLGINDYFYVEGYWCSPVYVTKDKNGKDSLPLRTLFSQEMINNGVIMAWITLCYSHGAEELDKTLDATRKALTVYAMALDKGTDKFLQAGSIIRPVFRKYN